MQAERINVIMGRTFSSTVPMFDSNFSENVLK